MNSHGACHLVMTELGIEIMEEIVCKLERWRKGLESKGFKVSWERKRNILTATSAKL